MLHNFKFTTIIFFYILFTSHVYSKRRKEDQYLDEDVLQAEQHRFFSNSNVYPLDGEDRHEQNYDNTPEFDNQNCWITLNAKQHFEIMDQLDENYAAARQNFEEKVVNENNEFDSTLLQNMLSSRGRVSGRATKMNDIPAGLNLGGYCMMRMNKSIIFFHRMKLRNETRFRINYLRTNFRDMQIVAQLSLNDLHLVGSYERAITDNDPSILYYAPSYGQVQVLLRDVQYKMEGRLRMLEDSLYIVVVNSKINFHDALMISNNASICGNANSIKVNMKHLDQFIERMKSDLDQWLRDYFNEQLILSLKIKNAACQKFREYEKKKIIALNKYVEDALVFLKGKLHQVNASNVVLPNFSIFSVNGMELKLKDGVLRGLDTMYRRSVATGKKDGDVRMVDAIVGFSSLKSIYKYNVFLANGLPPLTGLLILSADELTTHMSLSLVKDPETVDLNFDFIQQVKPESLTVEGPANRMIAGFKHVLEYHVIAIMTNTLNSNIRALRTLTKCRPELFGYVDLDDPQEQISTPQAEDDIDGKRPARIPDYVVQKEDSIEVELPPNDKGESKKVHLAHVESLNITKLNKK